MSEFDGLHARQYENLYSDDDVPLGNARKGVMRFALYASLVVVAGLVTAGFTLKIPRQITTPFVLKGNSKEIIYRFSESVFVEHTYVKAGMTIEKDSPVVKISSPEIVALINQYTVAKNNEDIFEKSEVPLYANQKSTLSLQQKKYSTQIADANREKEFKLNSRKSEVKKLELAFDAAAKQYEETKKLHKKGYAAEQELRDAEIKKSTAQDALSRAREQYNKEIYSIENKIKQLDVDRSMTTESSTKVELEITNKRAALQAAVAAAYDRLHNLYGSFSIEGGSLLLKAPLRLVVSYVNDVEKQVSAGSILLKLMTSGNDIYATASVPPQHIGVIKQELGAILKVSSFPHYNWGVVRGVVSNLSLTPDDKGNYPFEIRITDTGYIGKRLQIGMDGELAVLVEERTIVSYLFEKIALAID